MNPQSALDSGANKSARTSRYAAKRDAIVRGATVLFNQKGLRGVSLAEIAQSVGLVTNSVTYYYRKKEQLAASCYLRAINAHAEIFEKSAAAPTPAARTSTCVTLYFAFLRDVHLGKHEPVIYFDDIRALGDDHSGPVFQAYTDMFRKARALLDAGKRGKQSRLRLNARTHLFLTLLFWAPAWIHRYEPDDYARVAARINDVIANGLAGRGASWTQSRMQPLERMDEDEEISRETFLRATTELINDQGYLGASVDRISARLNVTKGSFYHHNENKDDLVVNCFERTFDVMRRAQNEADRMPADGWTKLCFVATALIRHQMSPSGPLLRTTALHALPEPIRVQMIIRMNRLSDRFAHFIVDGIIDGSIRPVDPVVAGQLINPMINGASDIARWAQGADPDQAIRHYVRPLFVGLIRPDEDEPPAQGLVRPRPHG